MTDKQDNEKLNEEILTNFLLKESDDVQLLKMSSRELFEMLNKARQQGRISERKRIIEMIENMKNETETGYLIGDLANQITEVIIEKLKNSEALK